MNNSIIDDLNRILTNTLEYKEVLQKMSKLLISSNIHNKLDDIEKLTEKESIKLIQLIGKLGGKVESTERHTDHESIGWARHPLPEVQNNDVIIDFLISIEQHKKQDYRSVLRRNDSTKDVQHVIENNIAGIESNLTFYRMLSKS